jgi:glucose dehydrogenase
MKFRCFLFALFIVQAPALFQRYCGTCHSKDIATLQEYSPERIYESITVGKMKAEAADIPDVQKRQIAEFLSARPMGSDEAGDMKKMTNPCPANPPMTEPSAGPAWNGWGNSDKNTRFQPAANAGLTADQVPNLKLKWAFDVPKAAEMHSQPTIASGRVFFGSDAGYIYSLDAKTGCVYWSFHADSGTRTAPIIAPVQGQNGAVVWRTNIAERPPSAAGLIVFGGASGGETVYYGLNQPGGGVAAIKLSDGSRVWTAKIAAAGPGNPAATTVIPGVVFAPFSDGTLRALSTSDGRVLWQYNTARDYEAVNGVAAKGGSIGQAGVTIAGGMLFIGSGYGTGNTGMGNVLLAFGPE